MRKQLFLSLAPHAISEGGHGVVYQQCLERAAKNMGYAYVGLFPKKTALNKLQKNWILFFKIKKYGKIADYFRLFLIKRAKTIFMESFNSVDFVFLVLFFLLFSRKNDRLLLVLRYDLEQIRLGNLRTFLAKLCRVKFGPRFALLTDSELIARDYQKRASASLTILPIPHTEKIVRRHNPRDKLICWWPGTPKKAKGYDEILRIASLPGRDSAKMELVAAETSQLPNTKLIPDPLTRNEYLFWLSECDFVLLPYDPIIYRSGTSGIFVEAIIAGKIPLVKEGSWLAYELQKFGLSELIVDWGDSDFFLRLPLFLKNPQVQEKRKKMEETYTRFHTQEAFTQALRGIAF